MNKYHNTITEYRGRKYHSIKEMEYAVNLDWKLKAGDIIEWEPQVKLPLIVNGVKICTYIIDFRVVDKNGKETYTEIKGAETELWKIKYKLAKVLYPELDFLVVK